jgi:pre-rRNA-processing protein IPI3
MADGRLLRSAALPSALNCVVMDAGEATLFAGGADGAVYEVSLVGAPGAASGSSGGVSGAVTAACSDIVRMECHSRGVNALSLSPDGEVMVSGSDDGTACVWDLRSRQAVQVIQGPGKLPVTSVLVMPQPEHMVAGPAGGSGGTGGRQGPRRPQPLAPLVKYPGQPGTLKSWEGPAVVIDGSVPYEGIAQACGLWGTASSLPPAPYSSLTCSLLAGPYDARAAAAGGSDGVAGPSGMMEVDAQANGGAGDGALIQEVARLKEELKQATATSHKWQALHTQLSKDAGKKAETGKAQAGKGGKRKL